MEPLSPPNEANIPCSTLDGSEPAFLLRSNKLLQAHAAG